MQSQLSRLVSTILVSAVAKDGEPGPIVFSAVTKKFDISTETLSEPSVMQKTPVTVIRIIILQKKY